MPGRLPGRCGKGWAAAPSPRGDSSRPLPLPPPSSGSLLPPGPPLQCAGALGPRPRARSPTESSRAASGARQGSPQPGCALWRERTQHPEPPAARRGCPLSGPRGWAPGGNRSGGGAPPQPQLPRPRPGQSPPGPISCRRALRTRRPARPWGRCWPSWWARRWVSVAGGHAPSALGMPPARPGARQVSAWEVVRGARSLGSRDPGRHGRILELQGILGAGRSGGHLARRWVCGRRAGGEETRSQLLAEPRRLQCDTHSRVRGGGRRRPGTGAGRDKPGGMDTEGRLQVCPGRGNKPRG